MLLHLKYFGRVGHQMAGQSWNLVMLGCLLPPTIKLKTIKLENPKSIKPFQPKSMKLLNHQTFKTQKHLTIKPSEN